MGLSGSVGFGSKKLSQTSAEQLLLRSIQALELEFSSEHDPSRREELSDQINDLKSRIADSQPNFSFFEKKQTQDEQSRFKVLQSGFDADAQGSDGEKNVSPNPHDDIDRNTARFRLYELLLNKYADLINEFEKKTVGEIKAMVNADDLTVQSIVEDFKKEGYSFERDYADSAKKAFSFISNEITFVKAGLDVNFWLSPKEIMNKKIGDDEDLAVFLCSVLAALGDRFAEVIIAELENLSTHAFVFTQIKEKFVLLDPSQKHMFEDFFGDKAGVLAKYSFNGSKIKRFLYKFNFEKYEQFV